MPPSETLEELWRLVRSIPPGRVAAYGELGRALDHPASGFMVGRWMAMAPPDVPWWRVIAKDGRFPVGKRDPDLERDQRKMLLDEGVSIEEGRVDPSAFWEVDSGWAD